MKAVYNTSSKIKLGNKNRSEETRVKNTQNPSKIPNLHVKVNSFVNEDTATSRRKISGLLSTRTSKRINFSMYSPSNNSIQTTKARADSFFFPHKRLNNLPTTAEKAIESYGDYLCELEKREMMEFKTVYFLGIGSKKVGPDPNLPNFGYDNDKGDYKIVIGDHLDFRYEIINIIGKGSFGQVCKCTDHKTKEVFAIKIVRNKRKFHKQGAVEVKLLKTLKDQDPEDNYNIVRLKNHFTFRSHLCLVFEVLSISLYDLLKLNSFQGFQMSLVSKFAIQLLVSLQYVQSLNIVHCDLKPENILLKHRDKCGIKIIDFGSGCFEDEKIYTYIQSRFYRAPEVMLGIPYSQAIDMWSFGCILAELYMGYPIFPGENESEQFLRIAEVIGVPPKPLLDLSSRKSVFFDSSGNLRIVPNSRGKLRQPASRPLESFLGSDVALFVDFLTQIFQWAPELRPSAAEALDHPWIQSSFQPQPKPKKKRRLMKSLLDINVVNDL
jgi:dual specificity tyrosine-phosphorylation-regulated kinase 2/3/4